MNSVQLNFTKRWLMICAVILIAFDVFTTLLFVWYAPDLFLQYEVNPLLKTLFVKFGLISFAFYPIVPFLFYYGLISASFWLYEKGIIKKAYFYFLFVFISFHLFVGLGNLLTFWVVKCG
jgi:hypothetical protein